MNQEIVERRLAELPLYLYAWLGPEELPFSQRVQAVCLQECPRYGRSWSCPPAVGTAAECRARCLTYDGALLVVTVQETQAAELDELLATKPFHTAQMQAIQECFAAQGCQTLCLSGDACSRCPDCSWPGGPCRHPEQMMPCLEGYGVVVSELAERFGVPFVPEPGLVYWYGLVLYRDGAEV